MPINYRVLRISQANFTESWGIIWNRLRGRTNRKNHPPVPGPARPNNPLKNYFHRGGLPYDVGRF